MKWSFLSVLIGMALLLTVSVVVPLAMIFTIIGDDLAMYLEDVEALESLLNAVLLNPVTTAILSVTEFVLVIPPFAIMRKYRKSVKERFMLLGWRPYTGTDGRGLGALGKDLALGLFIALGLVGFQFIVVLLNDLVWTPVIPGGGSGLGDAGASLTPRDPFQLALLVAAMMLVIGPTEEILFRGFSQQGLEARIDPRNAVVINALLFTLVHVIGGFVDLRALPFLFVPYFMLSLLFSGIYWKTKDLNLMIFIHGLYDSLLVLYSYLYAELDAIGLAALSDILVYSSFAAFGILGIYVVVMLINHKRQRLLVNPAIRAT